MSWLLPPSASSYAGDIDWLYYLILIITGLAFRHCRGGSHLVRLQVPRTARVVRQCTTTAMPGPSGYGPA